MTTLAVPYYGNLYHNCTGYERVYFIVNYDTETERTQDVRLRVWDDKQTPDLYSWLKENEVFGVVCNDSESLPLLEKVVKQGFKVLDMGSSYAQNVMKNLRL